MLKVIIYFNVLLLFLMSFFFLKVINNSKELKRIKNLIIVYIIYDLLSITICYGDLVQIGWNFFLVIPISLLSLIIYIIDIVLIQKKITKRDKSNKKISVKYIVIMILPIVLFLIPYSFELYVINKCDFLLKYNYQNGIIQSDDSYLAIINNKPVEITLQKNLFNRQGKAVNINHYVIVYSDINNQQFNNSMIKKIALDAKEKSKDAKSATIDYIPDGKYAIVTLLSSKNGGSILGEYFYSNGKYIKDVVTHGSLDSITYYK